MISGVLWMPQDACGTRPLILLGHGGGQHKTAPGTLSRARRYAAEGFAVIAIDAPNHGDRPRDEEFDRIAAQMRAGVAAGEDPARWSPTCTAIWLLRLSRTGRRC